MTQDVVDACLHCGLPLPFRLGGGKKGRIDGYCCSGCWVAERLGTSSRGVATPTAEGDDPGDRLKARIVLCALLSMGVMVFSLALYGEAWGESLGVDVESEGALAMRGLQRLLLLALTTPVVLLLGVPLAEAVFRLRRWFSADALVLAGVGAAFGVSVWNTLTNRHEVYFETTAMVLVFFALGRWLESSAKGRARSALTSALPQAFAAVRRLEPVGECAVDPTELEPGDRIRLGPGDWIPVDGRVEEGEATLDVSRLSGESLPSFVDEDDSVHAGSLVEDGTLIVRATATGADRLIERVESLVEEAFRRRSERLRIADRLSAAFLPVVLLLAVGTGIYRWQSAGWEKGLFDALCVVLISCPCSIGIATPFAYWIALGEARKRGVVVRGAEVLERLAAAHRVLLDKTGTLTERALRLASIEPLGPPATHAPEEWLRLAVVLEAGSRHPIASALRQASEESGEGAPQIPNTPRPRGLHTVPGEGPAADVDGRRVRLRRPSSAAGERVACDLEVEGRRVARFSFEQELVPGAEDLVATLRQLGVESRLLSGDREAPTRAIAERLGLDFEHSLSPEDKLERVLTEPRGTVFVGDGWNDSAALRASEVGVSVEGSVDRSLQGAGVNLLGSSLAPLADVFTLSRRARSAARWNLFWALGYNSIGLSLAVAGRLTPVVAAGLMVASSLFIVLRTPSAVRPRPRGQGSVRDNRSPASRDRKSRDPRECWSGAY